MIMNIRITYMYMYTYVHLPSYLPFAARSFPIAISALHSALCPPTRFQSEVCGSPSCNKTCTGT